MCPLAQQVALTGRARTRLISMVVMLLVADGTQSCSLGSGQVLAKPVVAIKAKHSTRVRPRRRLVRSGRPRSGSQPRSRLKVRRRNLGLTAANPLGKGTSSAFAGGVLAANLRSGGSERFVMKLPADVQINRGDGSREDRLKIEVSWRNPLSKVQHAPTKVVLSGKIISSSRSKLVVDLARPAGDGLAIPLDVAILVGGDLEQPTHAVIEFDERGPARMELQTRYSAGSHRRPFLWTRTGESNEPEFWKTSPAWALADELDRSARTSEKPRAVLVGRESANLDRGIMTWFFSARDRNGVVGSVVVGGVLDLSIRHDPASGEMHTIHTLAAVEIRPLRADGTHYPGAEVWQTGLLPIGQRAVRDIQAAILADLYGRGVRTLKTSGTRVTGWSPDREIEKTYDLERMMKRIGLP